MIYKLINCSLHFSLQVHKLRGGKARLPLPNWEGLHCHTLLNCHLGHAGRGLCQEVEGVILGSHWYRDCNGKDQEWQMNTWWRRGLCTLQARKLFWTFVCRMIYVVLKLEFTPLWEHILFTNMFNNNCPSTTWLYDFRHLIDFFFFDGSASLTSINKQRNKQQNQRTKKTL